MEPIIRNTQILLTRELLSLAKEVELFPDEKQLWYTPDGIANSAGNLVLHVCGNLNHYIGHNLGGTGYKRNRGAEFTSQGASRQDLIMLVNQTYDMVRKVLPVLKSDVLNGTYPEKFGNGQLPVDKFLLHLCVHLSFHLGQIGYLRRIITGKNTSSGAVSLKYLINS